MKRTFKYLGITAILMLLWAGFVFTGTDEGWFHQPIAQQSASQSFLEAVDRELTQQFVGNFAMATIKNGAVEDEKFYSVGKPVDRHTVFQVSSLSKWVSAFGMMKLVEQGKLDLDAPVSKYLTRWQLPPSEFDNEGVTVRRLLSHTAGLTDGLGYSGFENRTEVQSLEQSLTKASDADEGITGAVRVGIEPGTDFKYSGGGYTLLQLIVEEVSGQSFAGYMENRVFTPLKMSHSGYVWSDSSGHSLAEFYHGDRSRARHYHYTSQAATSLYTSLSDLELFLQAHLKGSGKEPIGRGVIKPETLQRMRVPHARQMGADIWGLGTVLFATTGNNDFIIGHDGRSTPPINTATRLNPETGDGIIILATGSRNIATRLASEWVFWKTGKVDIFLFAALMEKLFWAVGIGWAIIMGAALYFALFRNHSVYTDISNTGIAYKKEAPVKH